jgi:hypothetical protein
MGWLVFFVIAFGLYTGWKFLTVPMTKSQIENAIEAVLDDISHEAPDRQIRALILRRAGVTEIELEEDEVWIERESRHGERIIQVGVGYPVTFSYLGSERTVQTAVQVTKVIRVNEAAEARRAAAREEALERDRQAAARARRWSDKLGEELKRCKKATGSKCDYWVTGGGIVDPDDVEIQRLY